MQVGQNVGAGDQDGTNSAARVAIVRGAIAVGINAIIFLALGRNICWWFTDDAAVHAVAVAILPVIAVYQAADGLRVVGAGCLRGVGRLGAALISDIIGFWVLGVPIGAYLALGPPDMGMLGLWKGFCFGVLAVMTPIVLKAWGVGGRTKSRSCPSMKTRAWPRRVVRYSRKRVGGERAAGEGVAARITVAILVYCRHLEYSYSCVIRFSASDLPAAGDRGGHHAVPPAPPRGGGYDR